MCWIGGSVAAHPVIVSRTAKVSRVFITVASGLEPETALKIAPENVRLRADHGLLLLQKKEYAQAEKEWRWVLERADKSARTHLYLGRTLISLGNYDEAEKELQRAVELGGDAMHVAHRFLGAIYVERGENGRAIEELENFLRHAPNDNSAEAVRATIKRLRDGEGKKP